MMSGLIFKLIITAGFTYWPTSPGMHEFSLRVCVFHGSDALQAADIFRI
jgi:hypothetical protein